MSDDRWERYRELNKAYIQANKSYSNDYEDAPCPLSFRIAEFLLQPYWDMLNESKDSDV